MAGLADPGTSWYQRFRLRPDLPAGGRVPNVGANGSVRKGRSVAPRPRPPRPAARPARTRRKLKAGSPGIVRVWSGSRRNAVSAHMLAGMCAHIVLAEDDVKQAELVRRYLERERHTVAVVSDGRAALDLARRQPPDLLILDVMLPGMDGLDVCRTLRAESDLPILMLTARSTEDDLPAGLDLGADDYVTKP